MELPCSLPLSWTPSELRHTACRQLWAGVREEQVFHLREPAWKARARRPVSRQPWSKASASSWVGMPSVTQLELCLPQLSINGAVFLSGLWEHTPRSGNEPSNRNNLSHWVGTCHLTWRRGARAASPWLKDNGSCVLNSSPWSALVALCWSRMASQLRTFSPVIFLLVNNSLLVLLSPLHLLKYGRTMVC